MTISKTTLAHMEERPKNEKFFLDFFFPIPHAHAFFVASLHVSDTKSSTKSNLENSKVDLIQTMKRFS